MSRDLSSAPDAICILRLSAIGDCCHTLPVVRTLQAAFPNTRISWVIGTTEHQLLEGADGIEFITFDKKAGLKAITAVRKHFAGSKFPVLLNMNASMRANLVSAAIPARRRVGFDRARARDFQWAFSNEKIAERDPARPHVLDGLFQFAEHLGATERVMRWDIPVTPADTEFAAEVTAGSGPTCVISPCSSQRARHFRNWSVENYVELIRYLQDKHAAQVVLTGATSDIEKHYATEIMAQTDGVTNLVGSTSLKQLFAVITAADVVICPDSGPAHMANALGTPVIGLHACTWSIRGGPYNYLDLCVDKFADAAQKFRGKRPEEIRWGRKIEQEGVMDLIQTAEVIERLELAATRL